MKERDRGERIYVCVFECAREKLKLTERKKEIKRVHNSLLYSHCTQCVEGQGGRMGKSEYVCTGELVEKRWEGARNSVCEKVGGCTKQCV